MLSGNRFTTETTYAFDSKLMLSSFWRKQTTNEEVMNEIILKSEENDGDKTKNDHERTIFCH